MISPLQAATVGLQVATVRSQGDFNLDQVEDFKLTSNIGDKGSVGDTAFVTPRVNLGMDYSAINPYAVTFTTSNPSVATVSSTGQVKFLRTGSVTIGATLNGAGYSSNVTITVSEKQKPTSYQKNKFYAVDKIAGEVNSGQTSLKFYFPELSTLAGATSIEIKDLESSKVLYNGSETTVVLNNLEPKLYFLNFSVKGNNGQVLFTDIIQTTPANTKAPVIDGVYYNQSLKTLTVKSSSFVDLQEIYVPPHYVTINNSDYYNGAQPVVFENVESTAILNVKVVDVNGNNVTKTVKVQDLLGKTYTGLSYEKIGEQDNTVNYFDLSKYKFLATVVSGGATNKEDVTSSVEFEVAEQDAERIYIMNNRLYHLQDSDASNKNNFTVYAKYRTPSDKTLSITMSIPYFENNVDIDGPIDQEEKPEVSIIMAPSSNITPTTQITWNYQFSDSQDSTPAQVEWDNQKSTYPVGQHTVRVRAMNSRGVWSDWSSFTFTVAEQNQEPETPIVGNKPVTNIYMSPETNLTPDTIISWNYSYYDQDGDREAAVEWDNKSDKYSAGTHTVRVRVKDSSGAWSDWSSKTFTVTDKNSGNTVTTKTPHSVYTKSTANNSISLKEGETYNLEKIAFEVLYKNGDKESKTGKDLTFSLQSSSAHLGILNNKEFKFSNYAKEGNYLTVVASYKENGVTVTTNITFTLTAGKVESSDQLKSIAVDSDVKVFQIEEDDYFYLDDLDFEVTYKNGSIKTVNFKDVKYYIPTNSSKYIEIDKRNRLSFTSYADYNDKATVQISYTKNGQIVTTDLTFQLVKTGQSTLNQKPESITLSDKNVSSYEVKKGSDFNLSSLKFTVTYKNGATKEVSGSEIFEQEDGVTVSKDDKGTVTIKDKKLTFSSRAEYGDTATLVFQYTDNGKSVKTNVVFKLVKDLSSNITDLVVDYPIYEVGKDEVIDLTAIDFHVYYTDIDKVKVNVPNVSYLIQYKYKDLVELNTKSHTLSFKSDKVKYGDSVILEFSYKPSKTSKTRTTTVKFVYTDKDSNSIINTPIAGVFTDISGHWAESDILNLAKKNMIVGYEGTKYFPNRNVTRAEVAGFIAKYLGLKDTAKVPAPFTDVRKDNYYYDSIARVYESGVFVGYDDKTFKPDAEITREELATVLLRTYKYKEGIVDISSNTTKFADQAKIAKWAEQSVLESKALGLIAGRPNNMFDPKANTTRAEISSLLWRMYTK